MKGRLQYRRWLVRLALGLACSLGLPLQAVACADLPAMPPSGAAWAEGSEALLYVWSPRMVLSAQHAGEVAAVAADLGMVFVPALPPQIEATESEQALAALAADWPTAAQALQASAPLCSAALQAKLRAVPHYPTAWLWRWQGGQWQQQGRRIISAMPPAYWRLALAERRQAQFAGDEGEDADAPNTPAAHGPQ